MTAKMGRYRYWGDQKPDTSRPLLTFSRPLDAVNAKIRSNGEGDETTSSGTLRIYGPIDSYGGFWGVSAKEVAQALDLLGNADRIVVRVNSPGGESSEGRAIVNLLRAHSAKIVTVVDGAAYSAASYIAACGDDTVMSPGSTLMIHDTSTFLYGNADAFRKAGEVLDVLSNSGAELYAEIAGGTVDEWRERQKAETWYSAAGAVESRLMKRVAVVPDAGPAETAGDDGPEPVDPEAVQDRARAAYDVSLFDKAPEATHKLPTESSAGSPESEGGSAVALSNEQITMRQKLGIAEDADEATTLAALTEALEERADPPADSTAAPAIPKGMALVDQGVLKQLQDGANAGQTAQATLAAQERDRVINQALTDGKIAATSREKFAEEYDKNPVGTKALLDALTPGLVPTSELGHGAQPEASADDELYAMVFGDEQKGA